MLISLFHENNQPDDRGIINTVPVVRVVRKNTEAIHYVNTKTNGSESAESPPPLPMKPGEKVLIELDWKRRFDHMQQHSGQL